MGPEDAQADHDAYMLGFQTAEHLFYENEKRTDWPNPFPKGSSEWAGFEEAVYTFTQK